MSAAQSPTLLVGDSSGAPVQLAARSWCDVRLPAESGHEGELALQTASPARADLSAVSHRGLTSATAPAALLASGGMSNSSERDPLGPLRLDLEATVLEREPSDSFSQLKASVRGPGIDAEPAPRGEAGTPAYAAGVAASGSRTEPAIWAIVAIAVCGLGLAGLSAPWMAARMAAPKRVWRA
jgi:hypothetical protein